MWLPSGGSLVIDRTEAMTVVDVNTGKFIGAGGNLEETVTRNNLEAAEEIVRQLRLRDVGGIIVIDFIDMVLESNRDLVLRRLLECLGRDRTQAPGRRGHLARPRADDPQAGGPGPPRGVQRAVRACRGRGVIVHLDPVDDAPKALVHLERDRRQARASQPEAPVAVASAEASGDGRTLRPDDSRSPSRGHRARHGGQGQRRARCGGRAGAGLDCGLQLNARGARRIRRAERVAAATDPRT